MHHKIEYDCVCKSCRGTGLYVGFAEHDGIAVECYDCNGTGCVHEVLEYDDFKGRVKRDNIKRVVKHNPGVMTGETDEYTLEDYGGMDYNDWLNNLEFPVDSEMRVFVCPLWWYQGADYKKRPQWSECNHGSFPNCKHFATKNECWKRFDRSRSKWN